MSATRFTHAIARRPAQSVVNGLRDNDRGNPTYSGVVAEHDAYIDALRAAGVESGAPVLTNAFTLAPVPGAMGPHSSRAGPFTMKSGAIALASGSTCGR